jgi:hypothetical protein
MLLLLHRRSAAAAWGFVLISLVLSACAFPQRSETDAFRHEIKPGKIAEECRNLQPGERLRYRFEASVPMSFNVHFHRGNSVEYPVKIDGTSTEASIFAAQSAEEFCWMWTNGTLDVVVVQGELIRTK